MRRPVSFVLTNTWFLTLKRRSEINLFETEISPVFHPVDWLQKSFFCPSGGSEIII